MGLGALVHAYAVRAAGPLVVGLVLLASWLVWQTTWDSPDALTVLLVLFAASAFAASMAALHATRLGASFSGFSAAWREVGALLSLGALFTAALPYVTADDFTGSALLSVVLVAAGLLVVASAAMSTDNARLEPAMALAIGVVGVLLVLWEVGSDFDGHEQIGAAGWGARRSRRRGVRRHRCLVRRPRCAARQQATDVHRHRRPGGVHDLPGVRGVRRDRAGRLAVRPARPGVRRHRLARRPSATPAARTLADEADTRTDQEGTVR